MSFAAPATKSWSSRRSSRSDRRTSAQRRARQILYEDRRGPTRDFKLHELVLAAVHDTLVDRGQALAPHVLMRRLIATPKKSDSKVLAAIQQDADQLHAGRHAIVAWLDDDRIDDFELEIGEMDYGLELSGILGIDFLRAAGAVIDLRALTLTLAG